MGNVTYLNGVAVQGQIDDGSLTTDDTTDQIGDPSFTVRDLPGTGVYLPNMPVSITDATSGYAFSGTVHDDTMTPEPNGVSLLHAVNTVDGNALAARRFYVGPEWQNRVAGDIVCELIDTTLASEGITGNYAMDTDRTVSQWQEGQQTNTTVVNDLPGAVLELARAGTTVTRTESTAAQWNSGTLTGCSTSGNSLILNPHPALSFSGTVNSGYGVAYAYYKIWSGSYVIPSSGGCFLAYKVWVNSDSPAILGAVDGVCTDGTTIRDYNSSGGDPNYYLFDQNGLRAHPGTDLSGLANDQWYYRYIDLNPIAGKTLSYVTVCFDSTIVSNGTYIKSTLSAGQQSIYFYDVQMQNNVGSVLLNLYGNSGAIGSNVIAPTLSAKVAAIGIKNVQITPLIAYEQNGTRVSSAQSMQNAGLYQRSLVSWVATEPDGTSLNVLTSVDGGATFQAATALAALSNIPLGASLTSRNVVTSLALAITGKDPTVTPTVSSITWTVVPSYAATKHDTFTKYKTQANWNTGTLSETLATSAGDLTINSVQRTWDDYSVANQTVYGSNTPSMLVVRGAGAVRSGSATDARARLDFASTWQNFIMSVDVQVPGVASVAAGVVFRTTFWSNTNNTFAYLCDLTTTAFNFSKGSNVSTGVFTNLKTQALTLNAGDWHTITVKANGTSLNFYLDGVDYWGTQTDSSYNFAGNFGLRTYNPTGGLYTCYFNNFGVMPIDAINPGSGAFSGPTWTSPSISLGTFTGGNSLIFWDAGTQTGDYLNVQASVNGGTYANCTNGVAIPGITAGTAYSSATLQLKVQMQAASPADTPKMHGLTAWVTSQYASSGSRVSIPLPLGNVGNAGSATMTWVGAEPPNTAIYIDNAQDGSTFVNVGSGASGSAPLSGIQTQSDPVVDEFTANTSVDYTSTSKAGGTIAAWTWNTTNSRLTASGGSNAHLLYASPTVGANVDVATVMATSDNGGLVWGWQDQNNYYSASFHDASSPNNPNTARLFVTSGGTTTQLLSNVTISFVRTTPHIFRVVMLDTQITITMDGVQLFQITDTTLSGTGYAGLRNDNTGGASSATFYLFRIQFYGQDVTLMELWSQIRLSTTDPTVSPSLSMLSMSVRDASIQDGALIPQTSYNIVGNNPMKCLDILKDLARLSGNFTAQIVGNQVTFQEQQSTLAPWVMTDLDTYDDGNASNQVIPDAYQNQPWATGGYDVITQTQSFVGDGVRTSFDTAYPIDSISSMTVGSTTQTIGLKGVDTGKDWYYTQGATSLLQESTATPLSGKQVLSLTYNAQIDIAACVPVPTAIATMATRSQSTNTGIYEDAISMQGQPKAALITALQAIGQVQAQDNYILRISTKRVGLAPGQLLPLFLSSLKITNGRCYLVVEVKPTWQLKSIGGGQVDTQATCQITAVRGPNSQQWATWLDSLGGSR